MENFLASISMNIQFLQYKNSVDDLPEIMHPRTPPTLLRNELSQYSPLSFVQIGRITFPPLLLSSFASSSLTL